MTPLIKYMIAFIVLFLLSTFTLAGFGLWKLYCLGSHALLWSIFIGYGLITLGMIILVYRFLFCLKVDVANLVKNIKKVASELVKKVEVLAANPFQLAKVIIQILKAIKKKN